ncbi:MAG: phage integrase N-terminal SAM-like domain-containing protein [Clostridiales bacterium]|jgi:site-specific recombinase XerD|nr:phage integrase N-terminal SAM-like domain-containing protein [Clostridiales bacterium]
MLTQELALEKLHQDIIRRNLSKNTMKAYMNKTKLFLEYIDRPADDLTAYDVRRYLLHLRKDLERTPNTINLNICALRFFFAATLGRPLSLDR